MPRKRRKSYHHTAAGGWKFFFFVVKVDLPSTSQTVLLLYCARSGVAERRLRMTAVFCCGFSVLQILFCRVLSLPLTLKTSQTCSLVYTVNIRKITTLLLQQIRHTFCQTLCTKRGQNRTTCARNHTKTWSRKYLKRWTTLGKKTGNMYSTDTQRETTLLLKMSKPVENETNYRAK